MRDVQSAPQRGLAPSLLLLCLLLGTSAAPPGRSCASWPADKPPSVYGYEVVAEYPHDPTAFTQGLVFERRCDENKTECKDVFWESTGMYGESDVRLVDLATGAVRGRTRMDARWFGEGLVKVGDLLYQITWQGPTGFIYSASNLSEVGSFRTPLRDGWGATADGRLVVLSDGGANLTWVDPANGFRRVRSVTVRDGRRPVKYLNELEMVDGEVLANVWQTGCVARICPETGRVTGWLLLHGLWQALQRRNLPNGGKSMDVLNGIAWDPAKRRLFITGKYWPRVFEVVPSLINMNDTRIGPQARAAIQSCFVS